MFPGFLCIGAQKAGTTWLHDNLSRQPGVWLPPVKELHFLDHPKPHLVKRLFDQRSHHKRARANFWSALKRSASEGGSASELAYAGRLAFARRDWCWYESLFPADGSLISGEVCPGYARLSAEVIEAIVARNPRIRIIYLLRDPIDRAWSALAMHFRKKRGTSIIERPPGEIIARLKSPKFKAHSGYSANVERWLGRVPGEQIYFGFFDRIRQSPHDYFAEILRFLGVEDVPASAAVDELVNASRGERITPELEREIGRFLLPEAIGLHRRFANPYTERWLQHAEAAANG
jgi:hypothetical protein